MAFFSICIPTHNRTETLLQTVSTILAQSFKDYEIVVSDNASTPSAEGPVLALNDPRIRYYRHESPIDGKDNWDFAMQQARGDFVLLMADDDGLVPSALERVAHFISETGSEIVQVGHARYSHPKISGPNKGISNSLIKPSFTGKYYEYDSIELAKGTFYGWGIGSGRASIDRFPQSHPSGSFMKRELLQKVRDRIGWILTTNLGDVGFMNLLFHTDKAFFIDLPLAIVGVDVNREINGPLKGRRRVYDYNKRSIAFSPFKATTFNNLAVEAHLQVLNANKDMMKGFDGTLSDLFYINHFFEIIHDRVWDRRKAHDFMEWLNIIVRLPKERRNRILAKCVVKFNYRLLRDTLSGCKSAMKKIFSKSPGGYFERWEWMKGEEYGFNDMLSCGCFIECRYLDLSMSFARGEHTS